MQLGDTVWVDSALAREKEERVQLHGPTSASRLSRLGTLTTGDPGSQGDV